MAEQSSRTVEERFNWEDGDATLPIGWKMRCSNYLRQELFMYYSQNLLTPNQQTDKCNNSKQQLSYGRAYPTTSLDVLVFVLL